MRILTLFLAFMFLCSAPWPCSAQEAEQLHAQDYLGFSMLVSEKTREFIGLTTVEVEKSTIQEKIRVNGRIAQDVENVLEIYSPKSGRIKDCLTSLGSVVATDDVICLVEVEGQTIELRSPAAGVVMAEFAKGGDPIDPLFPLQMIGDLSRLSSNFDVYEKDMGKVQKGQNVLIHSGAYPDRVFNGKVVFVSVRVDEASLTVKIRVQIENPEFLLKPGMFVSGEIIIEGQQPHFKVPSGAVQNLEGINVVFLQDDDEFFTPTEVHVQYAGLKDTLVRGDIQQGDLVVAEGAFILKSKIMESEITGGCADGH